jgi:hypothetical protein
MQTFGEVFYPSFPLSSEADHACDLLHDCAVEPRPHPQLAFPLARQGQALTLSSVAIPHAHERGRSARRASFTWEFR